MERSIFRNYYTGHKDKTKGEGEAGERGGFGWGCLLYTSDAADDWLVV